VAHSVEEVAVLLRSVEEQAWESLPEGKGGLGEAVCDEGFRCESVRLCGGDGVQVAEALIARLVANVVQVGASNIDSGIEEGEDDDGRRLLRRCSG
jgi:hypothetical protein